MLYGLCLHLWEQHKIKLCCQNCAQSYYMNDDDSAQDDITIFKKQNYNQNTTFCTVSLSISMVTIFCRPHCDILHTHFIYITVAVFCYNKTADFSPNQRFKPPKQHKSLGKKIALSRIYQFQRLVFNTFD